MLSDTFASRHATGEPPAARDLSRSPRGPPIQQGEKRSALPPVLTTLQFSQHPDQNPVWTASHCTGSSKSSYQLSGTIMRDPSRIPKICGSQKLREYPGIPDVQIVHIDEAGHRSLACDVTYAATCFDNRIRIFNRNVDTSLWRRDGEELLMKLPYMQSVKTVFAVPTSRGYLRWEKSIRLSGFGRGKPLVDRWGRICAFYSRGSTPLSGRLVIFRGHEDASSTEAEDSVWVDELVGVTAAMIPQKARHHVWRSQHSTSSSYDYSGGGGGG
jgi:hypothetical protein